MSTRSEVKPKHRLWALVHPENLICYRFAENRAALWDALEQEEFFGTATSRKTLKRNGWRAVRVEVAVQ